MAKWIKASGEVTNIQPEGEDGEFTLEQLQKLVSGYIEVVWRVPGAPPHAVMVVNEEGLLQNLPVNPFASFLADQQIVGDVVVCSRKQLGD